MGLASTPTGAAVADLQAAKDELNRAIILHMATRWPTPADDDAAGEGP
jgi:hypothetical protein